MGDGGHYGAADLQAQIRHTQQLRKEAEQRLQGKSDALWRNPASDELLADLRPTLERERRKRAEAEDHVRGVTKYGAWLRVCVQINASSLRM